MSAPNSIIVVLLLSCVVSNLNAQDTKVTNVCTGLPHNTRVRNTQDCASYFHCFNGTPILTNCLPNERFDSLTRQCSRADSVECFACPADELFVDLPVANECQQFVRCFNNQTEQLTCAHDLAFDRKVQMCNHRKDVVCPFEVLCPREHEAPIFTRDRDDCGKFYICSGGKAEERNCPPTLYFNPSTRQCDHPRNANCPMQTNYAEPPIKENFLCPVKGGPLFPHNDCHKFRTCDADGMTLTHTCPNGGYFDYTYMFCGKRTDVTCFLTNGTTKGDTGAKPRLMLD